MNYITRSENPILLRKCVMMRIAMTLHMTFLEKSSPTENKKFKIIYIYKYIQIIAQLYPLLYT